MILIAPDKFKGTVSAQEFCAVARDVFGASSLLCCPMADGGEGTAAALSALTQSTHLSSPTNTTPFSTLTSTTPLSALTNATVIDSHDFIGPQCVAAAGLDVVSADSSALGREVSRLLDHHPTRSSIYVGVGGTGTCDAGVGFLAEVTRHHTASEVASRVAGLIDVAVPLLAPDGEPSSLMFAPQKGASSADMPLLRKRLQEALRLTTRRSPYDGAGGGLGFALASVLGCRCLPGAQFVLDSYQIPWDDVDLVITGEGRLDDQTAQGKVVATVCREATALGKHCIVVAGTVDPDASLPYPADIVACDTYYPDRPLTRDTALLRLRTALQDIATSKNRLTKQSQQQNLLRQHNRQSLTL